MSIDEFKRAKLMQDARSSGITVKDIARAPASMVGVKAVSDFDAGVTSGYLRRAEELLELAIEFAQERRHQPSGEAVIDRLFEAGHEVASRALSRRFAALWRND